MILRALAAVGRPCGNRCTFCDASELPPWSDDALGALLAEATATGCSMLVLGGGEPARDSLERWAERAAAAGLRLGLMTNGRALAAPGVLERLCARGLGAVWIGLHGPPAVHDRMTGAASFRETFAAVRRVARRRDLELVVDTVVTRANLDALREIVNLVAPLRRLTLQLRLVEPHGEALRRFDEVVPDVAQAAGAIAAALTYARERAGEGGPALAYAGVPLCLLPGLEDAATDARGQGFALVASTRGAGWEPVRRGDRVYGAGCGACALRPRCPGLHVEVAARRPLPPLRPAPPAPRANSFTYEPVRDLGPLPAAGGRCPAAPSRGLLCDGARALVLAHDGRASLCYTATRDFTDEEVAATRDTVAQLYLDVSGKPAPDDFPRDLRLLRPAGCAEGCRCHAAVDEDVFTRDDAPVRALVAGLRGRVLDAGCGGGARYADILAPLARRGAISYLGLDPDAAAIAALQAQGWGAGRCGTLEALADAPASFDAVLLLRAFNHLADPAAALGRVARVLRPGGDLVVADNVAFGLVRLHPPPAPAAGPPPRHEHFRNATSADAIALIAPLGFRVITHLPVAAGRSDQWLVHLRRDGGAA
jgi:SAM-dependent methyltransferase/MoaA/NifB/PqqE/SkfB family radical SAM enzyme